MSESADLSPARVPLSDLVEIDPEALPLTTDPNFTFQYIDISSASNGRLSLEGPPVQFADAPSRARRVVRDGDVLMSTVRPNLKAFAYCDLPRGDFVASTGFAILRPKAGTDPRFVLNSILSDDVARQIEKYVVGSNYPAINTTDVARLGIPGFAPNRQRRIAEILSTIDEAIEHTETLIAKTQQIKTGLMHDLFTRGVTPDGGLSSVAGNKPTRFGPLPRGWTLGSLLDVSDESRQPILTGPFGADLGSDDFVPEGVPVLRIGNVQAGFLDLTDLLFVKPEKACDLGRYIIREGDLLFARQGATTGRNALATQQVDGCLINYHIIRVALDQKKCAPLFIEAALNNEVVKRQVERDKGRGTREGISTNQLKNLEVPLAPLAEQRKIAELIRALDTRAASLDVHLFKLHQVKRGLTNALLMGRARME